MGDETGLLLTLGNYHSDLTYFVVVAIVVVSSLAILLTTRRKDLEYDVFSLRTWEVVTYLGIVIGGASALPLSVGLYVLGVVMLVLGVAATSLWRHRRKKA